MTNINNLTLEINDSQNLGKIFYGIQKMKFKDGNDTLVEFNFNFSETNLNLENIKIEKQTETDTKGSILIKGIQLTRGETKVAYINNLDSTSNSVCIKDEEINFIIEISPNCNGANEVIVSCPGINGNYYCSKERDKYRIGGLSNSGIKEFFVSPPSSSDGSSSGSDGGSSGRRSSSPIIPSTTQDIQLDMNQTNKTAINESETVKGGTTITGRVISILKGKGGYLAVGIVIIGVLTFIIVKFKRKLKSK